MSRPALYLRRLSCLSIGFALLALYGCALGPDYERPSTQLPESYRNVAPQTERSLADRDWHELFPDAQLRQLIERALQQNRDLAIAAQRVLAARANAGATGLARLPQLDAGGSATRNRLSTRGTNAVAGAIDPNINVYEAGIDASFELDLWGRLARLSEAAKARWQASIYDQQTVQITLIADVARNYFALQNLDRQLAVTHETIRTRERSASLIHTRHDAGAVSGLDVGQAEAELAAARAAVPNIQRQIEAAESALRILLGDETTELARGRGRDEYPQALPAGLPSTLLERRPDLQAAEQALVAANADVGAAKAALFPDIALTGTLGSESLAFSELFSGPARTWSYGAGLTLPLLNAQRSGYQLQAAKAQREIALLQYKQAVQQAFEDVNTALSAYKRYREQFESLEAQVAAYARYARLARLRYESGYSAYSNVLDAERQLFEAELDLAAARLNTQTAAVQIYRTLGGGWQQPAQTAAP